MERETIERLAMDRALGELNEDTTALFEAYLTEHPEVQPWISQMAQTCDQAGRAIRHKTGLNQTARPPARTQTHRTIRMPPNRWARWAAVIFISVTIGNFWGRWSAPSYPLVRTVMVAARPTAERQSLAAVLSGPGEGFWRDKAAAMLEAKAPGTTKGRSTDGGLWDRYRQLSKERIHE